MSASALFFGQVMHHRLHPREHRFRYRVMSLLLDLDAIGDLDRGLRFFSHNRFNLYAFYDRDHGAGEPTGLKRHVLSQLKSHGIDLHEGKILLLCYPRILGFVFNPLCVYYCFNAREDLQAILYEVSNTFGERHSYLLRTSHGEIPLGHEIDKCFYVSPFMPMDCRYRFHMNPPGTHVGVHIEQIRQDNVLFRASFTGVRRTLSDRNLLLACVRYPLMTLKIVAGIHWEALRLWCKGLRIQPRPAPPARQVTYACTPHSSPAATAFSTDRTEPRDDGDNIHETH